MKTFISPFNTAVLNLSLKNGIWLGVAAVTATSTSLTVISNWQVIEEKIKEISTQIKAFIEERIKTYVWDPTTKFIKESAEKLVEGYKGIWMDTKKWSTWARVNGEKYSKLLWKDKGELWGNFKGGWGSFFSDINGYYTTAPEHLKTKFEHFQLEDIKKIMVFKGVVIKKSYDSVFDFFKGEGDFVNFKKGIKELFSKGELFIVLRYLFWALWSNYDVVFKLQIKDLNDIFIGAASNLKEFITRASDLYENPIKDKNSLEEKKKEFMRRILPISFWELLKKYFNDLLSEMSSCGGGVNCSDEDLVKDLQENVKGTAGKSLGSTLKKAGEFYKGIKGWFGGSDPQSPKSS